MYLEQTAQRAMTYLDSVGVAADYDIKYMVLVVRTDEHEFSVAHDGFLTDFICNIASAYPQKSPV
ncbi:hypothetical protein [Pseudoalteromonas sp.]|uniref:hypothetical protein n=1 Tax=Pseudoalteromonas sp. TaxID=53249 RepID=UPI003D0EE25F